MSSRDRTVARLGVSTRDRYKSIHLSITTTSTDSDVHRSIIHPCDASIAHPADPPPGRPGEAQSGTPTRAVPSIRRSSSRPNTPIRCRLAPSADPRHPGARAPGRGAGRGRPVGLDHDSSGSISVTLSANTDGGARERRPNGECVPRARARGRAFDARAPLAAYPQRHAPRPTAPLQLAAGPPAAP